MSLKWREEDAPGTQAVETVNTLAVAHGEIRRSGVRSVAIMLGEEHDLRIFTFDSRQEVEDFIENVRAELELAWPKAQA